jgi:hypothetical protein
MVCALYNTLHKLRRASAAIVYVALQHYAVCLSLTCFCCSSCLLCHHIDITCAYIHTAQAKGDDSTLSLLSTPKQKQQQQGASLSRPSSVRGFFAGLFKDKEKGGTSSSNNSSSRPSIGGDESSGSAAAAGAGAGTTGRRLSASAHTATAAASLVSATLLLR